MGDSWLKDIKTKDTKSKVDLAKSVAKFSSQLKKLKPSGIKEKDQAEKIKSIIEEKTTQYVDEILVDAISTEYTQKKAWTPALKNIIQKFLSKSEDRNRVLARLKNKLLEASISGEALDNFITQTEEISAKKPETKITKIDREESERLKNENVQLRSTVEKLESELEKSNELKKEHKKVLDEKERVDNIIHHMAEGVVVVDSEGKTLLMNPAAEKLLNITKEEALGKPLRQNIKDEHLLTFTKDLMPDKEGNLTKEIELLSPDESTKRVLRTSSAVVENQDGKTVGMVTVLNDITRQKEIEKLKSDFVSNVSHELRTPLVVIQHSLSILTGEITDKLNEDQKKFFNNAQSNLERLRNLISDLLDMASIEAGKLKLKLGLFDINEIVKGMVEFLDSWAKTKNITLEANLLPAKTELFMDKDRITQVVTNLVGNAIKFTPVGGKVSVALNERAPDEGFRQQAVEVSVIDSGIGIEAKDLARLFNKFEQVSLAQPAGVGGTGLGLAIAKEIVQLHQGKIWAESEVGKGSKFSFLLPKNQGEAKNG
jgi:PAS domain S-box-containing protein